MRHRFHITDKLDDTTRDQLQRLQRAARIRDNRECKAVDKGSKKSYRAFVNRYDNDNFLVTDLY
jgi:hypothetical protein